MNDKKIRWSADYDGWRFFRGWHGIVMQIPLSPGIDSELYEITKAHPEDSPECAFFVARLVQHLLHWPEPSMSLRGGQS